MATPALADPVIGAAEHHAPGDVAAFYTGRRMTMISGYTPEGGDRQQERAFAGMTITSGLKPRGEEDLHGRLLARHMGNHIPGRPTFIVRTMPGAGGRRAADYLHNQAPRDGSVIGNLERGLAREPSRPSHRRGAAPPSAARASAFEWIGSLRGETGFVVAWGAADHRDLQTLFESGMIIGGTSADDESIRLPRALNALLGTRLRIIAGYSGTIELQIAMERGEIGGFVSGSSDIKSRLFPWMARGQARAVLQLGLQQDPELPDVPLAVDFARDAADRDALAFILAGQAVGSPYAAPPGTPATRVTALRNAFDATVHDGAFLADATRLDIAIAPLSGTTVAAMLDRLLSTPVQIRARASDAMQP